MSGFETRGRRDHAPEKYDFQVFGTAIVAITAILLSLAMGVPVSPDALMLIAP
jgi:hypothetical protein